MALGRDRRLIPVCPETAVACRRPGPRPRCSRRAGAHPVGRRRHRRAPPRPPRPSGWPRPPGWGAVLKARSPSWLPRRVRRLVHPQAGSGRGRDRSGTAGRGRAGVVRGGRGRRRSRSGGRRRRAVAAAPSGRVAQLARALPLQGRCRGSSPPRPPRSEAIIRQPRRCLRPPEPDSMARRSQVWTSRWSAPKGSTSPASTDALEIVVALGCDAGERNVSSARCALVSMRNDPLGLAVLG